jgi:hypothetical protein
MQLNNVKKKVERAGGQIGIAPGEIVLAACATNPAGSVKGMMAKSLGGAVGSAIANRKSGDEGASTPGLADKYPVGQHYLVLTNTRLLTASVSAMSGKPKELAAEWRIDEVSLIETEAGKMPTPMTITFIDGSVAQIEGAKGTGAETVPEAFNSSSRAQAA